MFIRNSFLVFILVFNFLLPSFTYSAIAVGNLVKFQNANEVSVEKSYYTPGADQSKATNFQFIYQKTAADNYQLSQVFVQDSKTGAFVDSTSKFTEQIQRQPQFEVVSKQDMYQYKIGARDFQEEIAQKQLNTTASVNSNTNPELGFRDGTNPDDIFRTTMNNLPGNTVGNPVAVVPSTSTTPPPNSNIGSYTFLAPLPFFGGPSINIAEGGLAGYLDGLYKAGVAVATGLALIMIVAGGLEYASAGSVGGKEGGKSKIKNALIGLLLALTSFIILQQINPGLVRNDLAVDATKAVGGITGQTVDLVAGGGTINQIIPPGQPGSYVLANNENPSTGTVFSNYSSLKQLLNSLPSGPRSTDGSLIFTNYWNGDTNTNQQRGNNCNLLVSGSVALSPDLISRYNPKKGAAVYVNGLLVGYFDDTTGATTMGYVGGTLIRNTIDIYDPNRTLGSVLKKMPPNSWYLVFGTQRAQKPNPCPR